MSLPPSPSSIAPTLSTWGKVWFNQCLSNTTKVDPVVYGEGNYFPSGIFRGMENEWVFLYVLVLSLFVSFFP